MNSVLKILKAEAITFTSWIHLCLCELTQISTKNKKQDIEMKHNQSCMEMYENSSYVFKQRSSQMPH